MPWDALSTDRLEAIEVAMFEDLYAAAPAGFAAETGLGWARIGGTLAAWMSRFDVLGYNRAFGFGPSAPADRDTLEKIAARFDAEGAPRSFVQIPPGGLPDDLAPQLAALGYAPYNRWAKLARPLADLPSAPAPVRVEPMGPDRAPLAAGIATAAFRIAPEVAAWRTAVAGRPGWHHFLAWLDGEAVGTAALFVADGVAWMGSAATLERARQRGVHGALIAHRLAAAAALGCTHAVVETAEDLPDRPAPSFRNQIRLGFTLCYWRPNYLRVRPPAPATKG